MCSVLVDIDVCVSRAVESAIGERAGALHVIQVGMRTYTGIDYSDPDPFAPVAGRHDSADHLMPPAQRTGLGKRLHGNVEFRSKPREPASPEAALRLHNEADRRPEGWIVKEFCVSLTIRESFEIGSGVSPAGARQHKRQFSSFEGFLRSLYGYVKSRAKARKQRFGSLQSNRGFDIAWIGPRTVARDLWFD
jgi:hypothetical protein